MDYGRFGILCCIGIDVEDYELYQPGGFHPVSIGDIFCNGRYKVVHKLGSGGSSTVWLARDNFQKELVALKILIAEASSKPLEDIPEVDIPCELLRAVNDADRPSIMACKDYFVVEGPNGIHLCLTYEFAGPSVHSFSGDRRLRGDLARKVAKQTAIVLERMHCAGFVHGDLTVSNILFRVSDQARYWSDDEVYKIFGLPDTEKLLTIDDSPPGPCAPRELVAFIAHPLFSISSVLQEDITVVDFGESFAIDSPPKDYQPATAVHYMPPESRFDSKFTPASDIWELACAIFEIRAGFPLFEPFGGGDSSILKQMVQILGKPPEPWWNAFEDRQKWFEDNGEPKPAEIQKQEGISYPVVKRSIAGMLRGIGKPLGSSIYMTKVGRRRKVIKLRDGDEPMVDARGTKLEEEEVTLLSDLLEKMLKYCPEERITIQEVVQHPWFKYTPACSN